MPPSAPQPSSRHWGGAVWRATTQADGLQQPGASEQHNGAVENVAVEEKRLWGVLLLRRTETRTTASRTPLEGHRHDLERVIERVSRRTTTRGGQLLEDWVREAATVEDQFGRVHSARVAEFSRGCLVREAAALYLPPGLSGRAVAGTAAAGAPAGVAAAGLLAARGAASGNAPSPAAPPSRAVGYLYADGTTTWGVISEPTALGLPEQRAVTRAALERSCPPPWQRVPACWPAQQRQARPPDGKQQQAAAAATQPAAEWLLPPLPAVRQAAQQQAVPPLPAQPACPGLQLHLPHLPQSSSVRSSGHDSAVPTPPQQPPTRLPAKQQPSQGPKAARPSRHSSVQPPAERWPVAAGAAEAAC